MSIRDELEGLLLNNGGSPVLFIGSGFSRRYIGLEDWRALLERFSEGLPMPFDYYFAKADRDLPRTAELLAADFNEHWWRDAKFEASRLNAKGLIGPVADPMKYEISQYLQGKEIGPLLDPMASEIDLLKQSYVSAVITTNWDSLIESLFPSYQVFVGQAEAISRRVHGVGEIYKIHGSCDSPTSLVMTAKDYLDYNERNPYLAAKLLALFLEHPVIFIGYSVSDPNIREILSKVSYCLDEKTREIIGRRIIIVRWKNDEPPSIKPFDIELDQGVRMNVTEVSVPDFTEIFSVLSEADDAIDASTLRRIKDHLYEIVLSSDPKKKIAVISQQGLDDREDIEFVVGVGVKKSIQGQGVIGLTVKDLLVDAAGGNGIYDEHAEEIVMHGISMMRRGNSKNIPVLRYLRLGGFIQPDGQLRSDVPSAVRDLFSLTRQDFEDAAYRYKKMEYSSKTMAQVLEAHAPERAVVFFTLMDQLTAEEIEGFVTNHPELLESGRAQTRDCFSKLLCILDRKKFGLWR